MAAMLRDKAVGPLLTVAAIAALAGCTVAPGPTPLAPAARTQVEVVYENQTDGAYVVSIVGQTPEQQGFVLAEPCTRSNMTVFADPPFEIGVGPGGEMEPQPTVVHSDDLDEPADGLYRAFVRIDAQGEVTSGAIEGSQELGPADIC
jgi:hypothetical protein